MRILTPCLIMLGTLVWPGLGFADISFVNGFWTTSIDYGQECNTSGTGVQCKDINNDSINYSLNNGSGEALVAANNPNGDGGMGIRLYPNDGHNNGPQPRLRINPTSQEPEIWLRYYTRFQLGFKWLNGNPQYDKTFDIWTHGPGKGVRAIPQFAQTGYQVFTTHGSGIQSAIPGYGWQDVFGTTSDGLFHMIEYHFKLNSSPGSTDGICRVWIDGVRVINNTNMDWATGATSEAEALLGWSRFEFDQNQSSPDNANGPIGSNPGYVDYDDIAMYKVTPPNISPDGDPWIGPLNGNSGGGGSPPPVPPVPPVPPKSPAPVQVIFNEPFEDQNWESRGWYDYAEGGNTLPLVNDGAVGGSTQSVEYAWAQGATSPTNTGTMRKLITPTDNIYVSYWVKYSPGYVGSQTTFHPHEFQMLTNKSNNYSGFNNQPLSLLIEQGDGGVGGTRYPRLAFANPANANGVYYEGSNQITPNIWHKVEVFMKLNTFNGNSGNNDGIFRYWLDGSLEVEATNIMMRDGAANTDMLINQFAIPPHIGVGSPVAQTFWVDELTIGTEDGTITIPDTPSTITVN